jgi:tryptophanyl-tRNA synthetase
MKNNAPQKKIILTGDRPTGKLHIGHYVGSLRRRVELQNSGAFDEIYIMIADTQALTDNFGVPQKVRDNIIEVALDYLAAGIDPSKSTIFVQSQVPELFELTSYYLDLVTLSRLERNPTVKSEIAMRQFGESIPAGFLCYPVSQAADITAFDATVVPVGEDQEPMIEQANEIVQKFNSLYGETLVPCKIMEPDQAACKRLPGTDGKAKMSKSLGNCIYLSDDAKTVSKKVMTMFTDPTHLKVEDPGHTDNNPVFIYLDAFAKDEHFAKYLPQYQNLDALKAAYQKGGLGDVIVKRFLADVLNDILEPMRARRKAYEADIPGVYKILQEGSIRAEKKAAETLSRVRRALGINYFTDQKLIEKQSKTFKKQLADEAALEAYLAKQKKN